jgi:hypothetical protein
MSRGENEGHLHMPPAGVAAVFAELSRIKSVIGIKWPEVKFCLEFGSGDGSRLMRGSSLTEIFP